MTFGEALEKLKEGKRATRKGWNGKSMFIYLTPGSIVATQNIRVDALREYCKDTVIQQVRINAHIDMKAEDGSIVIGWLASQTDMLATDWEVLS